MIAGRSRRTKKSWNGQSNSVANKGHVSQGNFYIIYIFEHCGNMHYLLFLLSAIFDFLDVNGVPTAFWCQLCQRFCKWYLPGNRQLDF